MANSKKPLVFRDRTTKELIPFYVKGDDVQLPDGKDLPTKLAELEDEIGEGGYTQPQDGVTVDTQLAESDNPVTNRAIKAAIDSLTNALNTLIGSGNVQGAIDTFNEVKAFLDGISSSDTLAAKLADFVTEDDVEDMIEEALEDVGGGSVESVTVSGTKYTPDINGDVDLGNLRGQDGNSGVASADGLESVNNLNGGTTDTQSKVYVLGANQGKRLRDQMELIYQRVQTLYGLLGNIAFWDGKPASSALLPNLDWGNPKHKVTLSLSLTNAVVKDGLGNTLSNGAEIQVEEGGTLTLTVEPASGYALTSVQSSTTGADVTDNGNGTYSVAITMGQSDMTLSISATGAAPAVITIDNQVGAGIVIKQGTTELEDRDTVNVAYGGTLTLTVEAASGYDIDTLGASIGGSTITPTLSSGVYTIVASNITSNATLSITGSTTKQPTYTFFPRKSAQINNGVVSAPSTAIGRNRATVLVPNEDVVTPTAWGSHDSADQTAIQAAYSLIPIPSGATAVKFKLTNSTFKVVFALASNTIGNGSSSILYDATWLEAQSEERTIDLTQYPSATQMSLNFKHADDSTPFELTDTMEGIGLGSEYFSFRFE